MTLNRRDFIRNAVLFSAAALLTPTRAFSLSDEASFHMLALGDSIMWGQGLLDQDKFWYQTKNWLEGHLGRRVEERIEAHSGASIKLRKPSKYPRNWTIPYHGEININTPTISLQSEHALAHYSKHNIPHESVGLILVNGGINDVSALTLVSPISSDSNLRKKISEYCGYDMTELLAGLSIKFPKARIVVTGYYPLVTSATPESDLCMLLDTAFRAKYKGPLEFFLSRFIRTKVCRSGIFGWIYKEMIDQSRIWKQHSDQFLNLSVERLNNKYPLNGSARATFIPAPFEDKNAYAARESFLWKAREKKIEESKQETEENKNPKGKIPPYFRFITQSPTKEGFKDPKELMPFEDIDPLYKDRRAIICGERDIKLKGTEYGICTIAATGHPNVAGAKAYANAIQAELAKIPQAGWNAAA